MKPNKMELDELCHIYLTIDPEDFPITLVIWLSKVEYYLGTKVANYVKKLRDETKQDGIG